MRDLSGWLLGLAIFAGLMIALYACTVNCEARRCPPGTKATYLYKSGCFCVVEPEPAR